MQRDQKNKNSLVNCLITCSWAFNMKKDKVQEPQQSKMLTLYFTALGFITKVEEYNPK